MTNSPNTTNPPCADKAVLDDDRVLRPAVAVNSKLPPFREGNVSTSVTALTRRNMMQTTATTLGGAAAMSLALVSNVRAQSEDATLKRLWNIWMAQTAEDAKTWTELDQANANACRENDSPADRNDLAIESREECRLQELKKAGLAIRAELIATERAIAATPAEGLAGIGIKLALAGTYNAYTDRHSSDIGGGAGSEIQHSALDDAVRLTGIDFETDLLSVEV